MRKATIIVHSDKPPEDFVERVRRALSAHTTQWCTGDVPNGHALAYKAPMKLVSVEKDGDAAKVEVEVDLAGIDRSRHRRAVAERIWDFLGLPETGVYCNHGPLDIKFVPRQRRGCSTRRRS
jgi:hypothetical protein